MGYKIGVINITNNRKKIEEKIEKGEWEEPVRNGIKKEDRKKPNYRAIIKEDKHGNIKRHGMIIEDEKELYDRGYKKLREDIEERKIEMEKNKDKRCDVNNMLKDINNKETILTPTEAMEWLSEVVRADVTNANGISLSMEVRLKAATILKDYYKELKPDNKEDQVKAIEVTIKDLSDTERVETIASEVGMSKEELDELKAKAKQ